MRQRASSAVCNQVALENGASGGPLAGIRVVALWLASINVYLLPSVDRTAPHPADGSDQHRGILRSVAVLARIEAGGLVPERGVLATARYRAPDLRTTRANLTQDGEGWGPVTLQQEHPMMDVGASSKRWLALLLLG